MRHLRVTFAGLLLAFAGGSGAAAQEATAEPECRESLFRTADGRQTKIRYCRQADGSWRRVAGAELPQPPFPYRSNVSFRGTYELAVTRPAPRRRNIELTDLFTGGGTSHRLEGAITIAARFDGDAAYAQVSGTGGLDTVSLSGLVRQGSCRLVDQRQTILYEGRCDREGFKGTLKSGPNARFKVKGTFDTRVASIADLDRP